jgi:hypothetical protein
MISVCGQRVALSDYEPTTVEVLDVEVCKHEGGPEMRTKTHQRPP